MPLEATKSTHKAARDLFKACVLGVQYGMGPDSLALRIGKSTPYAKELPRHHKEFTKSIGLGVIMSWIPLFFSEG